MYMLENTKSRTKNPLKNNPTIIVNLREIISERKEKYEPRKEWSRKSKNM